MYNSCLYLHKCLQMHCQKFLKVKVPQIKEHAYMWQMTGTKVGEWGGKRVQLKNHDERSGLAMVASEWQSLCHLPATSHTFDAMEERSVEEGKNRQAYSYQAACCEYVRLVLCMCGYTPTISVCCVYMCVCTSVQCVH